MTKGNSRSMIIMLVVAGLLIGGVIGFQAFKRKMIGKAMSKQAHAVPMVSTTVAKEASWQPTVEAQGSFVASQQASLSAEVGGLVSAIYFESGEEVRAGQKLVELNAGPEKAQLQQLQAQATLAEVNLKRDRAQLAVQAISQSVVDTDVATLDSAQARVRAQRALVAQDSISCVRWHRLVSAAVPVNDDGTRRTSSIWWVRWCSVECWAPCSSFGGCRRRQPRRHRSG